MIRKFMTGVLAILVSVLALSVFINSHFIERFFLYRERGEINRICDRLTNDNEMSMDRLREIEDSENVVVVLVDQSSDNAVINEQLRAAFLNKGVSLKKYWLWEEDQQSAMKNGRQMRIYHQEKLRYSMLVAYFPLGQELAAVAKIIPSVTEILSLVNRVTTLILIGAGSIMLLLILILVKRITRPLGLIGEMTKAIAASDFCTLTLETHDELEVLAADISKMSLKLKETQGELEEKNKQMEELLSNVSHDLKTPISLIKAYSCGIKDGIDDGTFLDTIINQNNRLEQMSEQLLQISRTKHREVCITKVELSECLKKLLAEYRILSPFECHIEESLTLLAEEEAIQTIFTNLLSNAVKYAKGQIDVELIKSGEKTVFRIANQVKSDVETDLSRIWDPFYVADSSRNQEKSGTGLGLTIVKAAALKYGYEADCKLTDGKIQFEIIFKSQYSVK